MKRPYVNFRELKAAVPIARVLERYGLLETLKEKGEALSGPCPFCEGRTSFRVNTGKNCFHCFSCRAGGNMLDLVALKEECPVRDAAVRVAEWFGVETSRPGRGDQAGKRSGPKRDVAAKLPSDADPSEEGKAPAEENAQATAEAAPASAEAVAPSDASACAGDEEKPPKQPYRPLTFELKLDPEHPWFAEAGLLPDTVREFGLGFCSKGVMGGRICFPLRNASGELVGYAGRWPGDDPPDGQPLWRYPKGLDLSQVVYPAERLADTPPGQELFASDPLRTVLARQLGLEEVYFVPGVLSLEECGQALERDRR